MTVNTNNGYHPEPSARVAIEYRVTAITLTGPDGKVWGGIDVANGQTSYRLAVPADMIEGLGQHIVTKLAESKAAADQANGDALAVPRTGLILPPGV